VDATRWRQVSRLVEEALARPETERAAFIARACGGDAALCTEVETYVQAHDAGQALEVPAAAQAHALDVPLLTPHDRIGPYIIEQELARGGMGIVYRAFDDKLKRPVALKAISPHLPRDVHARERLRREALAAAALAHDSIARVYALEERGEDLFIVSELVTGQTMRARLASGPLPVLEAVQVGARIARGLDAAHGAGIIHRDLKPENVMLTADGGVKVLDFGIASFDAAPGDPPLTGTGVVLGTPGYMSPEQLRGQPVDARSDVFALGVLLYEVLTGQHPFGRTSTPSVVAAVLEHEPEPLHTLSVHTPPALGMIVRTCLAKRPELRYPSAAAVASALETVEVTLMGRTPRPSPAATPWGATASAASEEAAAPLPLRWYQVHQGAATVAHSLMLIPLWRVQPAFPRGVGRALVLTALLLAAATGIVRLHLLFTSSHEPRSLGEELTRTSPWLRWGTRVYAALLVIGGGAVADTSLTYSSICLACAAGVVIAAEVIEPAAAARALRATKR
jgi:hypothetical protein